MGQPGMRWSTPTRAESGCGGWVCQVRRVAGVDLGAKLGRGAQAGQGVDSGGVGAGAERHQGAGPGADRPQPLGLLRGGDRPLDEGDVELAPAPAQQFAELDDLHQLQQLQKLLLEVEDGELAPLAAGEIEEADARFIHGCCLCQLGRMA